MLPDGSLIGLNPYELPGLRRIAEKFGVELGESPTPEEIQEKLFKVLGAGKLYGANAELLDFPDEQFYGDPELLDLIDEWLQMIRLRSVYGVGLPWGSLVELGIGGTANWMVRRARESSRYTDTGMAISYIYLLGSSRLMEDKAGTPNVFIREYEEEYGHLPTESQLLARIHHEITGRWQDDLIVGDDLDDNVMALARKYPLLADSQIYMATNAAAADKPLQVRGKLREVFPGFDNNPEQPQFYFSSDGFQVARTPEEAADPASFQRPKTFLSYIPRLVNQLYLLQS